jgi:hypothetical protein
MPVLGQCLTLSGSVKYLQDLLDYQVRLVLGHVVSAGHYNLTSPWAEFEPAFLAFNGLRIGTSGR